MSCMERCEIKWLGAVTFSNFFLNYDTENPCHAGNVCAQQRGYWERVSQGSSNEPAPSNGE